MLRAYFDGSGKMEDPKCSHITLAGFSAEAEHWHLFEETWARVLTDHNAPSSQAGHSYWHSSEAFHQNGGYAGWAEDAVEALAIDLFKVLNGMPLDTIVGFAATVRKSDYAIVKLEHPNYMSPEVLCLEHCLASVIGRVERTAEPYLELIFDKSEPFEPIVHQCVKRGIWWAKYLRSSPSSSDACSAYPLQACDFLGWFLNRYHSNRTENASEWHEMAPIFVMTVPLWHVLYDATTLRLAVDAKGAYHYENLTPSPLGCEGRNMIRWQHTILGRAFKHP